MNPKQCFQHHIWRHFKYWNHQEKRNTEKKKNGTKHITKRTSVYSVRIKTRQSVTLLNHSWEKAHWMTHIGFFFSPPLCRCLQMMENELEVLILVVPVSFSKQMTSQIRNPWITRLNWISTSLLETRKPEHGVSAAHRAHLTSAGLGSTGCHVGSGELRILGVLKGPHGQGWARMRLWPVQPHSWETTGPRTAQ